MSTRDLGGPILKAVSRSFYLSVRILPRELRAPVGLAYLLARASDTIADSPTAPAEVRLHHLAAFDQMIQTGSDRGLTELQRDISSDHPGERELLTRLDQCLLWLASLSGADQTEIRSVLEKIIHGQTLDLQRFPEEANTSGIRALQTAAELEEYTYLVAGCVGEFWTRISVLHRPNYSRLPLPELTRLGVELGKALQLVNILRDLPPISPGPVLLTGERTYSGGVSAHSAPHRSPPRPPGLRPLARPCRATARIRPRIHPRDPASPRADRLLPTVVSRPRDAPASPATIPLGNIRPAESLPPRRSRRTPARAPRCVVEHPSRQAGQQTVNKAVRFLQRREPGALPACFSNGR